MQKAFKVALGDGTVFQASSPKAFVVKTPVKEAIQWRRAMTEPGKDSFSCRVNLVHHLNLVVSFKYAGLVDAEGVHP